MKVRKNIFSYLMAMLLPLMLTVSCDNPLDEPLQNQRLEGTVDYTDSDGMISMLHGAYGEFYNLGWEIYPAIAIRGDDVSKGALGDQEPFFGNYDRFNADDGMWFLNNSWGGMYGDIIDWNGAIESIELYKEAGADAATADQYIAEIHVMRGFTYLQLARIWGDIFIIESTEELTTLSEAPIDQFEDVMQHISDLMAEVADDLPAIHPADRSDIQYGITRYTALAVKAMADSELKNWQAVADATGAIISSNQFDLYPDFYQYFKIPGKNARESLLEFQYSDFGTSSGTTVRHLWQFFGPGSWTPVVSGSGGGWGFWEPTQKFITFMLDRGETVRLETSVRFTPDGIDSLTAVYGALPGFISNISQEGDIFNNHPRYIWQSGKFYIPSTQLTPGRTAWMENANFKVIRYPEVLLMHAEALVNGASSSAMSADEAVNEVRARANMAPLSGVTLDDVLDEKFAEFNGEWGIRFYDMVRHGRTNELTHEGKVYDPAEDRFAPYPLAQQDLLPQLKNVNNNE